VRLAETESVILGALQSYCAWLNADRRSVERTDAADVDGQI
jgi:hypothetical protein